jgi:exodeoxyribonuclease V
MAITEITLTDKQNKAKNEAIAWFRNEEVNGKDSNRIFTVAGLAGTGKSTMVSVTIEDMNLDEDEVAYVAYTGMAASVLLRKGNKNAMTIHKLIYNAIPIEDDKGIVVKFDFILKDELDNKKLKLIVVDEVSMVNEPMLRDLQSFGIKIMALGDPGQLPPISGGNTLLDKPDVFLDEILRQALDNPIIYVSMLAREGKRIPHGLYGDAVQVIARNELHEDMFKYSDQIIAGYNKTVKALNLYHRKHILGVESPFPIEGDKMICLKNDWNYRLSEKGIEVYLVNGLIGHITGIQSQNRTLLYKMGFKPSFIEDEYFPKLFVDKTPFLSEKMQQSVNPKSLYVFRKPIIDSYGIQEFAYGNVITCHKSQGSEFNNVLLFNEVLNRQLHNRWLYTGITRAKEKLILVM